MKGRGRSGWSDEIGSIEPGKRADLIVVDRDRPHLAPDPDPWSTLVYAARGTDVRLTMVDGEVLVRDFVPCGIRTSGARFTASRADGSRRRSTRPALTWLARSYNFSTLRCRLLSTP